MDSSNNPKAAKKAAVMAEKSALLRRVFGTPEGERVIQDYASSLSGSLGGRLYISENFICWDSSFTSSHECIPLRSVVNIFQEESTFKTYIVVQTDKEKYYFSGFFGSHFYEAFHLMTYVWQNPPSYLQVQQAVPLPQVQKKEEKPSTPVYGGSNQDDWGMETKSPNSTRKAAAPASSNPFEFFGEQQQIREAKVDTFFAKEALRIAKDTESVSLDTLTILAEQGEQINRISAGVDRIQGKLDQGDRLLRDIESLPAYIGHALMGKKENKRPVLTPEKRVIAIKKGKAPPMDIEILCKLPDDSFLPAIIAFEEDGFSCIDPKTNKLVKDYMNYTYDSLAAIKIRSRPEHADLLFKNAGPATPRFRFMSSYLQIITNEFVLRCKQSGEDNFKTVFETGAFTFDYGNPRLSATPPKSSRVDSTFHRPTNTSSLLSADASQENRDAMDENDKALDSVQAILGNLNNILEATNEELDHQNTQLVGLNQRIDATNERVENSNKRMDTIMRK